MLYSELFLALAPLAYACERFPRSVMVHTCSITGAVSALLKPSPPHDPVIDKVGRLGRQGSHKTETAPHLY